ncbi:lipoyl(octanoyl) transferase LipB [Psychromonas antarctica]|jgi:lipoyl(octanoyl) transferase|uniref:lipoyl(octanoyl) transferase LipB n=1 Tax=Psychromonas antarctica TaxID=67573 RepID=UPI001EE7AA23|nr:lipoyl(octanoyl) transferase LipB [Psychromonas antarctica]MCG6199852.1 lipoyl(octanoyl) transferase LipB [Psychromonas antarctica]
MTVIEKKLCVRHLGLQPYLETWQKMSDFTTQRDENTVDEIWLVEHPAVFTQGSAGKAEHLLHKTDIPVIKSDRGGQITYHAPGQLIVYLLINIRRQDFNVRTLVSIIEHSIIDLLADYQVNAIAKADAPGVYVEGKKIASLGLKIRKGCSFHGLALNVDMDLSPFLQINPCGYAGLEMTQCKNHGIGLSVNELAPLLIEKLNKQLHYSQIESFFHD